MDVSEKYIKNRTRCPKVYIRYYNKTCRAQNVPPRVRKTQTDINQQHKRLFTSNVLNLTAHQIPQLNNRSKNVCTPCAHGLLYERRFVRVPEIKVL